MKKVKVMLLATLVVAGVGGALAFKAHKGVQLFCGTANSCPDGTTKYITAANESLPATFCSTQPSTDCPIRVTFDN
jgi:hypothetical protein